MKKLFKRVRFELKMRRMDREWRMLGGPCFQMYPPSFYYRHTPEEIAEIKARDMKEMKELLKQFDEQ